jgi:secreted trypsin-like serine protease
LTGAGRRSLVAIVVVVCLVTFGCAQTGRAPDATPGVVALIDSGAPPDDIYNAQYCAAVLISPLTALTAAHCVRDRATSSIQAVVGADNLCRDRPIDGTRIGIASIDLDPLYEAQSGRHDLALITLDAPISSLVARAVARPAEASGTAVAVGWGRLSMGGVAGCALVSRPMEILPSQTCEGLLAAGPRSFDSTSML